MASKGEHMCTHWTLSLSLCDYFWITDTLTRSLPSWPSSTPLPSPISVCISDMCLCLCQISHIVCSCKSAADRISRWGAAVTLSLSLTDKVKSSSDYYSSHSGNLGPVNRYINQLKSQQTLLLLFLRLYRSTCSVWTGGFSPSSL